VSIKSWWIRTFRTPRGVEPEPLTSDSRLPDLREFVYLDEVSLRSLLSSQKGGITDSTSEQAVEAQEASLAGTVGANAGVIAKAEVASRYQTTNSSTIQTSRKATVQSWFRELHEIEGLRTIEPVRASSPVSGVEALLTIEDQSLVAQTSELRRGKLIEIRVRLAADPVFHLGTMVSEFTAMAEDYPDMFAAGDGLHALDEAQPVNRILQRLLAGLVPIRARAVDYVVVDIDGTEYVVHKDLVAGLGLASRPLEIVGVTEHEAYWKDLRRVLFSEAEFTVLARISRSGLFDTWTPVKLADLFSDLTPGLVEQLNAAGRVPFTGVARQAASAESKLGNALSTYAASLLAELGKPVDDAQGATIARRIRDLRSRASSVTDQRSAFAELTNELLGAVGGELDPERALELRNAAREASGLSFFPALAGNTEIVPSSTPSRPDEGCRLLDVDFVAIYW
jgi:hypothetical protein